MMTTENYAKQAFFCRIGNAVCVHFLLSLSFDLALFRESLRTSIQFDTHTHVHLQTQLIHTQHIKWQTLPSFCAQPFFRIFVVVIVIVVVSRQYYFSIHDTLQSNKIDKV